MKLSPLGLRKAAILVSNLDTAAADAVLDQLPPDEAQQVRRLAVELEKIDSDEQQRVIEEFFRVGPLVPAKSPPGIELDGRLAWLNLGQRSDDCQPLPSGPEPSARPAPPSRPLRLLHEAEAEKLVRVLDGERPQTIAVVLSHLPPGRAGAILAKLPAAVQVEVIRRLVDIEETDPVILREVEEAIEARLAEQVHMQQRRAAGLQALCGILEATEGQSGMQILDNLAVHDRKLAERLGPQPVEFDDLTDFDDELLVEIFEAAGQKVATAALLGAPPRLVERVLARLPQADALRRQLNEPGPIRLRDVEQARRQVAALARRISYAAARRQPAGHAAADAGDAIAASHATAASVELHLPASS
jgi:flagellar motor switch protein FliG